MKVRYHGKGASVIEAPVTDSNAGGFTAVASTGSVDRDGEIVQVGAFNPLPESVPVHADHSFSVSRVIGRARPYYAGKRLLVDVTLGSGREAQDVRQKVLEGLVDSLSIVFTGIDWQNIDGVRTCVKGELLACDVVTVPSNRDARILAARGFGKRSLTTADARAAALLAQAWVEIAQAEAFLREYRADPSTVAAEVRRFLRTL